MTLTVKERWRSPATGEGENAFVDSTWIVRGTDDAFVAKTALAAGTPSVWDGLVRQSYEIGGRLGKTTWAGGVRYGRRKKKEPGDSTYQFDTSGGTQHITQALATIGTYVPAGAGVPDFHGAIGATLDSVEGVDIVIPTYAFSETHYLAQSAVTGAYKAVLFSLTGRVNNSVFRGFAVGEVLFLGASGSLKGDASDDPWEISFKFAASPNVTNLMIGSITVPAKEGWQYLWVRYEDTDDPAKLLVKRPVAAVVQRVYEYGNFVGLGIGM